jgi:hypothetical protein
MPGLCCLAILLERRWHRYRRCAMLEATADNDNTMMRRYLLIAASALILAGSPLGWAGQLNATDFFKLGAQPQLALAEAAANGRTDELEKLVSKGADVNAQGVDGMTALYWAMAHSSKKGVDWLLTHRANPNVIFTRDGTSATSLAAMQEDSWFLTQVLIHGGDPNIRNPLNEHTPIFDALAAHLDLNVRTLIGVGADMNTYDHLGMTPLTEAAANWRFEVVYDMLTAGADPRMTVPKGRGSKTLLTVIRHTPVPAGTPQYESKMKVIEFLKQQGLDVEHGD